MDSFLFYCEENTQINIIVNGNRFDIVFYSFISCRTIRVFSQKFHLKTELIDRNGTEPSSDSEQKCIHARTLYFKA